MQLQRVQPGRIGGTFSEQPHALAQRLLIGLHLGRVGGLASIDQPVEEPPAVRGALQKQPVLGRGQPDLAEVFGQTSRWRRFALDAHQPAGGAGLLDPGAEAGLAI